MFVRPVAKLTQFFSWVWSFHLQDISINKDYLLCYLHNECTCVHQGLYGVISEGGITTALLRACHCYKAAGDYTGQT